MGNDPTPAEALASIDTARGALNDRLQIHWSYDLLYGLAWWGPLVTGGIAAVVAMVASRLWMRAYRRDLSRSAV
jgi:hypothetical protein